jgi:cellulose-binding protein
VEDSVVTKLIAASSAAALSLTLILSAAFAERAATQTVAPARYKYLETPAGKKPRIVITADPELDDNNSMIRYILMSDGYQTEGLIYASSQFHWTGDGTAFCVH